MERLPELSRFLDEQVIAPGVAPAAVAGVVRVDDHGRAACIVGAAGQANLDSVFDLASVTKPFVALTVARLVERSALSWDAHLSDLLPDVAGTRAAHETLEALLSHRAGLPPHVELFVDSWRGLPIDLRALLRQAADSSRADGGRDALYSDLGYLLVGAGLAQLFALPLDELVTRELTGPLDIAVGSARMWSREPTFVQSVVPTELQTGRAGLLRGQVHDDNSWALSGSGLSGHAGLFGALPALLDFGALVLEGYEGRGAWGKSVPFLSAPRAGGSLRLGFDGWSGPGSLAGKAASPRVFGHLGFTGTSFWCDPDQRAVTVLLTNRVHPRRDNPRIRGARLATQEFLWSLIRDPENRAVGLDA